MIVDVAAAVIERPDGSFLLAQRPAGKVYAGWWEFPGGKLEPGEDAAQGLARELHEELGIDVRRAYPWITRVHAYEHATVRLHFFRVVAWEGEPHSREGQAFLWQRPAAPMAEPMLPANAPVLKSLAVPLEYAITDALHLGVAATLERLQWKLERGLRLVQVRDRQLPDRAAFVKSVVAIARRYGARVFVSGDASLGDGIHFTAAELARLEHRGTGTLAAASCHTREELERAMRLDLDFAVVGPVKPTVTHPGAATLGWESFARLVRGASIPVFAIGGLQPEDLHAARSAGAHGIAMIRGSWRLPPTG